jgi:D-sedoheptulose 7-phosphate isomerase
MNNIDYFFTKNVKTFSKAYFNYLKKVLDSINTEEIHNFIEIILSARERDNTIFFIGNGGSAATASHFANDLAIGTRDFVNPFRVMSLTDNVPIITAISNDDGYSEIFVQQLKVLAKPKDILVAISASGNSLNLIKAIEYCQQAEIETVAITAFDGGEIKRISKFGIHVPTEAKEYGPAEDAHMVLDHLISSYLMRVISSS